MKRRTLFLIVGLSGSLGLHGALAGYVSTREPPAKRKPKPPPEPERKPLSEFQTFEFEPLPPEPEPEEELKPEPEPEEVVKPEPEPEPEPEEEVVKPEPEPEPEPPKPKPKPKELTKKEPPKKRREPKKEVPLGESPKDAEPAPDSVEPAPFQLANVSLRGGIKVNQGDSDTFGDPSVAPTSANTKPRRPGRPDGDPAGAGTGAAGSVDMGPPPKFVQARPKIAPKGRWPNGAPVLNRRVVVVLRIDVDENGKVKRVKVTRGAGDPFDSTAKRDLLSATFEPATRGGVPVATTLTWKYFFDPP